MSGQPLLEHLERLRGHCFDVSLDLHLQQQKHSLNTQFQQTLLPPSSQEHLFNRLLNTLQHANQLKAKQKKTLEEQLAGGKVVCNDRQVQLTKQKTIYGQLLHVYHLANNAPLNVLSIQHALSQYPQVMQQLTALFDQQLLLQKEHHHEIKNITKAKQDMQRAINGQQGIVAISQAQTLKVKNNFPVYDNRNPAFRQRLCSMQRKHAFSQERRTSLRQKLQNDIDRSVEKQVKDKAKVGKAERVLHLQRQMILNREEETQRLHRMEEGRKRTVRRIFFMEWMLVLLKHQDPVQELANKIQQGTFQEEFIKQNRLKHLNRYYLQAKLEAFFQQNGCADQVANQVIRFLEEIKTLNATQFNRQGDLEEQKRKLTQKVQELQEEAKWVVKAEETEESEAEEEEEGEITVNRLHFREEGAVARHKEAFVNSQRVVLGLMTSMQSLLKRLYSTLCNVRLTLGTKLGQDILGEGYQDLLAALRLVLLNQVNGPSSCPKQAQMQKQDNSFLFFEESQDTSQSSFREERVTLNSQQEDKPTPRSRNNIPTLHRRLVRAEKEPIQGHSLQGRLYAEHFQDDLMLQLLVCSGQKQEAVQSLGESPSRRAKVKQDLEKQAQEQLTRQLESLFQAETNLMLNLLDLTKDKYTYLITNNPCFSFEDFLATDSFRTHLPYLSSKQDYLRVLHKLSSQAQPPPSPRPQHLRKEQEELYVGQVKKEMQARQQNFLTKEQKTQSPSRPQSSYQKEEKRLQRKYLGKVIGLVSREHKARKELSLRSPRESHLLTRPSTYRAPQRPASTAQSMQKGSVVASLDVSQVEKSLLRELQQEEARRRRGERSQSAEEDLRGLREKVRANRVYLGL